jgi:hypothetical protein
MYENTYSCFIFSCKIVVMKLILAIKVLKRSKMWKFSEIGRVYRNRLALTG